MTEEEATTTDQYGRRTWNLAEYDRRFKDREKEEEHEESGKKVSDTKPKETLKPREKPVDLESKVGKSVVVNKSTPTSQAGGFFCEVCDCVVKDSINYLDHINGKKHQKNMGFSMKVQRSTLEECEARFQASLKKNSEVKKEYDVQERIKELKEEEERLKEYRKEKKKEKKKRKREQEEEVLEGDDQMSKLMGFSSFSSKK
jgi:U4/U6.U5 tri-snRNP component SNU23